MKVTAVKTHIIKPKEDLLQVIADVIPSLPEKSVLVVTSKVVSYWQNRMVKIDENADLDEIRKFKHELARKDAERYLDPKKSKYNLMFTVKDQTLAVNAGIDESNANGYLLLWPEDPQKTVNEIWKWACEHYGVKELGVTLSDSKTYPLRWGVTGTCIVSCGFNPLFSYIGEEDLFGYKMKMEQTNVAEAATIAAVLEMGEGSEQKPLAVVEEISNIEFVDHVPSGEELADLNIDIEDDFFEPLLTAVNWKEGVGL